MPKIAYPNIPCSARSWPTLYFKGQISLPNKIVPDRDPQSALYTVYTSVNTQTTTHILRQIHGPCPHIVWFLILALYKAFFSNFKSESKRKSHIK